MKAVNLENKRFGRLIVVSRAESTPRGQSRWSCQCDCGQTKIVRSAHLQSGSTKSCGCINRERVRIHGNAGGTNNRGKTSEYNSWVAMKTRCYNKNYHRFDRYGGRGIKVCDRWRDNFVRFLKDMGKKPAPGFTIDRIDNDGNYEPGNCRWLSQSDNMRHARGTLEV